MFSQYFQVGYFPKFDYCEFAKTFNESNFLYTGVKFLKQKLPETVRDCPYIDSQLQVNDLLLTDADFRYVPKGKYKVICTFSDDDDKKILRMITHVTIWINKILQKKVILAVWAPLCWMSGNFFLKYSLHNFT